MSMRRTWVSLATLASAVLLGAASYSWACSATAYLEPLSPASGGRGTEVTVTGRSWVDVTNTNPVAGPVEIRWGSEAGPVLALATGPSFSVKVTVPDAPPDYYLIVGVARNAAGEIAGRQSRTFRLTGTATTGGGTGGTTTPPATDPTPAEASPPAATTQDPSTTPAPSQAQDASPGPAATTNTANAAQSTAPANTSSDVTQAASGSTLASPAGGPPSASATRPAQASAAPQAAAAVPAPDETQSLGHSDNQQAAEPQPLPDAGQLWENSTAAREAANPSLASEPVGSRGVPAIAMPFLAFGLIALFAGAVAATVKRRNAVVRADTNR